MLSHLKESNQKLKNEILTELREFVDETTVNFLFSALNDEDPHVRRELVYNLSKHGGATIVEPLLQQLHIEANSLCRQNIIATLSGVGDKRIVGPLLELLQKETNARVYDTTVIALTKLGDSSIIEFLQQELERLRQIPGKDVDTEEKILYLMLAIGSSRDMNLYSQLVAIFPKYKQKEISGRIVKVLASFDTKEVRDLMFSIASDQTVKSEAQEAALFALIKFCDSRAVTIYFSDTAWWDLFDDSIDENIVRIGEPVLSSFIQVAADIKNGFHDRSIALRCAATVVQRLGTIDPLLKLQETTTNELEKEIIKQLLPQSGQQPRDPMTVDLS